MGKQRLTLFSGFAAAGAALRGVALAVLLVVAIATPLPVSAVSTTLGTAYAVDPLTGAALEGYDAVSYFTDDAPVAGRPEFEFYWAGVPWYFSSAANRDVFKRAPQVYAPMFGGYATMSVARGFLSAGNPRIYTIMAGRLFLFYSSGNKEAFLLSPRDAYQKAETNWATLGSQSGI